MSLFAVIFALLMLSLFWGGFVFMLFYSLKLKSHQEQSPGEDEESGFNG